MIAYILYIVHKATIVPISHFKKVAIISPDSVAELMFARLCLLLIVQTRPEPVPALPPPVSVRGNVMPVVLASLPRIAGVAQ